MTMFRLFLILFFAASFMAPATVAAQTGKNAMQHQAATKTLEVDQNKIDAYALAAVKVGQIHSQAKPQIEAAQTREQKTSLLKETEARMISAIQGTEGIKVAEYNAISQAVRNDKNLFEKVKQAIAKIISESPQAVPGP